MQIGACDIQSDEEVLTILLHSLLEERSPEGGIPRTALKRRMRLKEAQHDIKQRLAEGGKFTPADYIRFYSLLYLFVAESQGLISFAYEDVFKWIEFKSLFYELTSFFDEIFDFKRSKGNPGKPASHFLMLSGVFCREHNTIACKHRDKCRRNYRSLLVNAMELRLRRSQEWQKRTSTFERKNILSRELKAAKTSVDRFWKWFYGQKSPKLGEEDKKFILRRLSIAGIAIPDLSSP